MVVQKAVVETHMVVTWSFAQNNKEKVYLICSKCHHACQQDIMLSFIIPVLINMTKSVISAKGLNQYYVSSGYKEIFTAYLKNIHVISLVMVCDSPLFLFSQFCFFYKEWCMFSFHCHHWPVSVTCLCVRIIDLGQLRGETSRGGCACIRGEGTSGQLQSSICHRNQRHPALLHPGRRDR